MVANPENAYQRWHAHGEHGRIVVALSRWLNFVETDEKIPNRNPVPLHVMNLAVDAAKQLSSQNFLYLAVRSGIAREIIHVVPESGYVERLANVKETEGAKAREHDILAPHIGTPRRITTLTNLSMKSREPVLLYINASFFSEYEPKELLFHLKRAGVRASDIVLCLSEHDDQVKKRERERLKEFAELLENAKI